MRELKFQCGKCGQRLSATDDEIGLAANCPTCGAALIIPPAGDAPEPADVPPPEVAPPPTEEPPSSVEPEAAVAPPVAAAPPAPRPVSTKLAAAIAATKAFGLTYRDPDWVDEKGEEYHVKAIDGFFEELYRMTDLLHAMEAAGEIVRLPDADELQAVRVLLFEAVLHDKWSGNEADLKGFILQGAPGIRPG